MTPEDVKAWRGRLGLSQKAAAEALGLHYQHYRRLETGTRFDKARTPVAMPGRTLRLAMAAVTAGLADPWPDPAPDPATENPPND